ncbi:MAG: pyridoxal phosphate-dependent aminotransferase [Actinobacteria bacterium]|nr:pyridoxal phosphate-dependent aminotransferase [Actinomycetota bacterium]
MKFTQRMSRLGTENAFVVLAEVTKLKEQGRDIINFGVGEPDFDTPLNIKNAGINAIENNHTHYSPPAGVPDFRRSVARYISRTRNIEVSMDNVIVGPGTKPVIFYALSALIESGDEVIYPNPGYPIYESLINYLGAKAVPLALLEEKEFSFDINDLKKAVTTKTRMIIINSPQNPTGGILSKSDLQGIAEIAAERDLWVMSDEIYSRIIYDGEFASIISFEGMKDRTILIDGFSKIYSMTGWRLGYGIMNKELIEAMIRLNTNIVTCTATFTQYAGIEGYEGPQDETFKMVEEFRARRDMIVDGLNDIKGFSCLKPKGAFYVFPNVTRACRALGVSDSRKLQQLILHEGSVAVLPRTSFGSRNQGESQEYIRLSYATSRENIMEGLKRIKIVVEK